MMRTKESKNERMKEWIRNSPYRTNQPITGGKQAPEYVVKGLKKEKFTQPTQITQMGGFFFLIRAEANYLIGGWKKVNTLTFQGPNGLIDPRYFKGW